MNERDHILFKRIDQLSERVDLLECKLESLLNKNSKLLNTSLNDCEDEDEDDGISD